MNQLTDVSNVRDEELPLALRDSEERLERTSLQIAHLNSQITYLRKLFRRAEKNNNYAVRYNLRMQLSISSGVKVMFHHYSALMEARVLKLQVRLRQKAVAQQATPTPSSSFDTCSVD